MFVIVWEYGVKPDRIDDFESFYRPDGPWTRLFRAHPGFVSTTLMKDLRSSRRYVVADRWTSEKLYDEFKKKAEAAYDDLTARGHRLIDKEKELGRFDFVE
jgi:heme-degrading monooxygenase HmoA